MTLNLEELETLLAAATPGPWEILEKINAGDSQPYLAVVSADELDLAHNEPWEHMMFADYDTKALVALRNAAPALIARVRELEDENDVLNEELSLASEDWEPIETAPRENEIRILVLSDDGEIFTANWDESFQEWYVIGDHTSLCFTHWKHLPKPPTE